MVHQVHQVLSEGQMHLGHIEWHPKQLVHQVSPLILQDDPVHFGI